MREREQNGQVETKKQRTKTSKVRKNQTAYLWEFENFIKERLRALGIIQ